MPHQACFELPRFRVDGRKPSVGWLTLALSAAALTGCTQPYYSAYRNYPPPVYVPPPPYAAQPPIERPWPAPYPLFPAPEVRQEPAPMRDNSVTVLELPPLPDPAETPFPEAAAPPIFSRPPAIQAGPGNDAPLQGFRPMRGQTRPGI